MLNDLFGYYSFIEESTDTKMSYIRIFPIQISLRQGIERFYYELSINLLGLEFTVSLSDW